MSSETLNKDDNNRQLKIFNSWLNIANSTIPRLVKRTMLGKGQPANELQRISRENKHWGSRDRHFINSLFYSLWRWWGWTSRHDSKPWKKWGETEWNRAFVLTLALDNSYDEFCSTFGVNSAKFTNLTERISWLEEQCSAKFNINQLVPAQLKNALMDDFSKDWEEFVAIQQQRSPAWIRSSEPVTDELVEQFSEQNCQGEKISEFPNTLKVDGRFNINTIAAFKAGKIELQDLASQCVALYASPKDGESWWDCCCGSGGKALHLSDLAKVDMTVSDIRESVLKSLKKRLRRKHQRLAAIKSWDGTKSPVAGVTYDGVIVDAPCSNSGTWRRDPWLRHTFDISEASKIAELQLQILTNAAQAVKVGGTLVYATCSIMKLENIEVIEKFLAENSEFYLDSPNLAFADENVGYWQVDYRLGDNDSLFVARMKRKV